MPGFGGFHGGGGMGGFHHGGWGGGGGWGHHGWGGGWGWGHPYGYGYGGGGLGMGLLGGALIGSALASPGYYRDPYYYGGYGYGAPVVVQQPPTTVVMQPAPQTVVMQPPQQQQQQQAYAYPPGSAPPPGYDSSSSSSYPAAAAAAAGGGGGAVAANTYRPVLPRPPSYVERQKLHASGYGQDPDLVFSLWENQTENSVCGMPGPYCPSGNPVVLAVNPGAVPHELTDLYTTEEWITFRSNIEALHEKYQWHNCPMGFLALCFVPCCLTSSFEDSLTAVITDENSRLLEKGVMWDWNPNSGKEKYEIKVPTQFVANVNHYKTGSRTDMQTLRLLTSLRVMPDQRQIYESEHPMARRIYQMPQGQVIMPRYEGDEGLVPPEELPKPKSSPDVPRATVAQTTNDTASSVMPAATAPVASHSRSNSHAAPQIHGDDL